MRIASFTTEDGSEAVGIIEGSHLLQLDVTAVPGLSAMRRLLIETEGDFSALHDRVVGDPIPVVAVRLDAVVPDPGKVVAAPVNYADHQAEMQEDYHIDTLGVFLKAPTSVLGDDGVVRLPYTDRRFDQEGELAVVIGRRASHVTQATALSYIAGYTMLLDMTMRGGEDRSTRKSFDTFTPVGPWLVTPDEAGDPAAMRLRTWVAGELRQDADIADLIWDVPRLIAYASSVMVLQPGDIVTTGTPAGIGQVHDGDDVAVEIAEIGRLHARVSSEGAVACPTRGAGRGPKPPDTVTQVRERG